MSGLVIRDIDNIENCTKIKIIGVGGAGCNAINTMVEESLQGVDFLAVNTDIQVLEALTRKQIPILHIGERVTNGQGTGTNPELGAQAAETSKEHILEKIKDADMLFITAGEGGGTGTGAAPVIAEYAKELGILTVGIVTYPFRFEGKPKAQIADLGIDKLKERVNSLIVIENELAKKHFKSNKAALFFKQIDHILYKAVRGISDIIKHYGMINVDFNDVKRVLKNADGTSETIISFVHIKDFDGDYDKVIDELINNKLTKGNENFRAKNILTNVIGNENMEIDIYSNVNEKVVEKIGTPDCFSKGGLAFNDEFADNEIYVTLVASGLVKEEDINIENKENVIRITNNPGQATHQKQQNSFELELERDSFEIDIKPIPQKSKVIDIDDSQMQNFTQRKNNTHISHIPPGLRSDLS